MTPPPPTDWMSATAMLLCGLVLGFMFIISFRKKPAPSTDIEREDLEAKRDALIGRLREVEDDTEERARLEQEAAEVLRRLDGLKPVPAPARVAATTTSSKRAHAAPPSQWKGFAWGAGSVAAIAAVAWFVAQSTKERGADGLLTGGGAPTSTIAPATGSAPAADSSIQELEAAVRASPDDMGLRHKLAQAYLDRENLMGVFEQTSAILQKSPNDARALTYQAIVRMAMGQAPQAVQMLETATKSDPGLLDAWVTLAWLRMQGGDDRGAASAIDSAIKAHPEEAERLRGVLGQMRARVAETPATPPPSSGPSINVTVDVDPAIRIDSNAVLFVFARAEGVTSGPPIAAKRVPAAGFPVSLTITQADSMMGQPLPERVRIEARVDADGVATTRDPSEPKAAQDGVATGSTVTLTLK